MPDNEAQGHNWLVGYNCCLHHQIILERGWFTLTNVIEKQDDAHEEGIQVWTL